MCIFQNSHFRGVFFKGKSLSLTCLILFSFEISFVHQFYFYIKCMLLYVLCIFIFCIGIFLFILGASMFLSYFVWFLCV